MTPTFIKISEGKEHVGIGETTLRELAKKGAIHLYKPEGLRLTLISVSEVTDYIKQGACGGPSGGPESV